MEKGLGTSGVRKVLGLTLTIVACVLVAFYVEFVLRLGVIYTHLFYIPIILAGIWYYKRAVYVALVLGITHILARYFATLPISINEIAEMTIFLAVAYVIGLVSEKAAEEAKEIQVREKEHQTILNSVPVSIFHINSEGRFMHVNEALAKRYGMKPEDFTGKTTEELFPEKAEEYIKSDREVLESEEPQIGIARKITTPEGVRWVRLDKVPLRDADGNVIGIIGFELDIAEGMRAIEAVQERERFFSGTLNDLLTFVAVLNPTGEIIFVNNTPLDLIGRTLEDIKGRMFYDTDWWAYSEAAKETIKKDIELCAAGKSLNHQIQVQTHAGLIWIEFSMHPIYDEGGAVKYLVPEGRDITGRKEAEEALRASEERFRELADLLPQTVFELDIKGNFTYSNRHGFESTGFNQEDVDKEMNVIQVVSPEDRERAKQNISKKLAGRKTEAQEYKMLRKDGSTFPAIIYSLPIIRDKKSVGLRGIVFDITELKRAEDALRESEERFRTLAESANAGIVVIQDTKFVYVNPETEQITGYTRDELLSMDDFTQVLVPEYRDLMRKDSEKPERGELMATRYEAKILSKSGEERWMEISPAVFQYRGRAASAAIAIDITERKRTEEELKRYQVMVESAHDAIFFKDRNSRYIIANDKTLETFGLSREEVIGKNDYELMPNKKEAQKNVEDDQVVFKTGKPAEVIKHMTGADGKEYCFQAIKVPDFDTAGNIAGLIGVARDITERKKTEDVLKESEEMLSQILQGSSIPTFVIDSRHVITHWNKACENLTGLSAAEMVGTKKQWSAFYPEERPVMADFIVDKKLEEEIAGYYRGKYQRSTLIDGAYEAIDFFHALGNEDKWLFFTAAPLRDSRGNIIGAIETLQDITELKQAEKRQLELIAELDGANKELKDFAYVISHDLKAPLRAINSLAEWISADYSDKLDETGKEHLELLRNRVKRMHHLIDGIMEYSRVGRLKEEKEEVNLNTLISEVIVMINPPANIEIEVVNQLPTIYGERTRMEQVFQNLMSNAVRYMNKPKGRVTIGCTEEGGYWKFRVADNGPGIKEKHYDRIFQIFQTLKPRDEVESTGVGLTIVKKIVETQGGKIWLESKEGEGSTFFFTVPKSTEEDYYESAERASFYSSRNNS